MAPGPVPDTVRRTMSVDGPPGTFLPVLRSGVGLTVVGVLGYLSSEDGSIFSVGFRGGEIHFGTVRRKRVLDVPTRKDGKTEPPLVL